MLSVEWQNHWPRRCFAGCPLFLGRVEARRFGSSQRHAPCSALAACRLANPLINGQRRRATLRETPVAGFPNHSSRSSRYTKQKFAITETPRKPTWNLRGGLSPVVSDHFSECSPGGPWDVVHSGLRGVDFGLSGLSSAVHLPVDHEQKWLTWLVM